MLDTWAWAPARGGLAWIPNGIHGVGVRRGDGVSAGDGVSVGDVVSVGDGISGAPGDKLSVGEVSRGEVGDIDDSGLGGTRTGRGISTNKVPDWILGARGDVHFSPPPTVRTGRCKSADIQSGPALEPSRGGQFSGTMSDFSSLETSIDIKLVSLQVESLA